MDVSRRLRRPRAAAVLVAVVLALAAGCSASGSAGTSGRRSTGATKAAVPSHSYYVSLGDSLAAGFQPTAARPDGQVTTNGYADDIFRAARATRPGLQLVKMGCPGETTTTMMNGGDCHYAAGSQLASATDFLRAHGRQVAFVTIDIGANDVDTCGVHGIDPACVTKGMASLTTNLGTILARLRQAAPPGLPILTMNLYDPYLAGYLYGAIGTALADASLPLLRTVNSTIARISKGYSVPTADVAGAFDSYDIGTHTALAGHGQVPTAVARLCQLTWICTPPLSGANIHPNDAGYQVIAGAFRPLVPRAPVSS